MAMKKKGIILTWNVQELLTNSLPQKHIADKNVSCILAQGVYMPMIPINVAVSANTFHIFSEILSKKADLAKKQVRQKMGKPAVC